MLAASSTAGVILLALGGALALTAGAALYLRGRSKEQAPDIPDAMRPGPADTALETPLLQKLQGWGVVLGGVPGGLGSRTPGSANLRRTCNRTRSSRPPRSSRGERAVQLFSEENQLGVGCVRCHGPELRGGVIQVGATYDYPPNLTNLCAGPFGDPPHPAIYSTEDIYQVIEEGRGNMPSWSIRYEGALDDQQINDLVELPRVHELGGRALRRQRVPQPRRLRTRTHREPQRQPEGALMEEARSCLGFALDCATLWKGAGVTIMGFILFVGSVYVLLSAIMGRYMGFLVLVVAFSGWMIVQSALWLFGFWSQGLETPTNLGPRGSEPAWVVLEASTGETSDRYETFAEFPTEPWAPPDERSDGRRAERQRGRHGVPGREPQRGARPCRDRPHRDPGDPVPGGLDPVRERRGREDQAGGGRVAFQRRWTAVDRVVVLRLGQRAPVLVHVPGRFDHRCSWGHSPCSTAPRRSARSS